MSDGSQFKKVILLIVLAIFIFLGFKEVLPNRLFSEKQTGGNNTLIDSVLLEALSNEDLVQLPNIEQITEKGISDPDTIQDIQESIDSTPDQPFIENEILADSLLDPNVSEDGYRYLRRFYSALNDLEENPDQNVRVAYFGDSMNDGDFIVQDVRTLLQDSFGGNGVGYVAITSLSAASRGSVHHKFSNNWHTQSFVSVRNPSTSFGVDGQVFLPKDNNSTWVSYSAGYIKNSTSLYNPRLFYGRSENEKGMIRLTINKEELEAEYLTPNKLLNISKLSANTAKSITINFDSIQDIPIYGVDFSSARGIHVDNFSLRGNSGLALSGFNTELMNAFDRVLGYDLIILHYGTNVLNYGSLNYLFYEKGMSTVINKLHRCFPNADILVVSTADKASKEETEMVTDPAVPALVKAQRNFSRSTHSAFIDLYSKMGGKNSMIEWVDKELANKDYTHFNARGSKEVAKILYKELMKGYDKYKEEALEEKVQIPEDKIEEVKDSIQTERH